MGTRGTGSQPTHGSAVNSVPSGYFGERSGPGGPSLRIAARRGSIRPRLARQPVRGSRGPTRRPRDVRIGRAHGSFAVSPWLAPGPSGAHPAPWRRRKAASCPPVGDSPPRPPSRALWPARVYCPPVGGLPPRGFRPLPPGGGLAKPAPATAPRVPLRAPVGLVSTRPDRAPLLPPRSLPLAAPRWGAP